MTNEGHGMRKKERIKDLSKEYRGKMIKGDLDKNKRHLLRLLIESLCQFTFLGCGYLKCTEFSQRSVSNRKKGMNLNENLDKDLPDMKSSS